MPSEPSEPPVPAADPFGAAGIRRRVLDGWAAAPARFREDANAEEDFALTGYRDRLLVELAQNAADAATRAGVPGRLLLSLEGDVLVASNTGAPLDATGVEALSTLRASAKRDDDTAATVGRYGVGFAAVLAVTDDPAVVSMSAGVRAGVRWSRALTLAAATAVPALTDELVRRDSHVPVLRLPFELEPAEPAGAAEPREGYDTSVLLPLRDAGAIELVRRLLAEVDAGVLLMLPALAEVVVDDGAGAPARVLRAADLDVRLVERSGRVDPDLLADRPTEERRVTSWSVRWAQPRPDGVPAVVHAPTPTDEPLDLPVLLLASFPLDTSRRHVAPGPLRDFLVDRAAAAYVDLVREVADGASAPGEVLELVPGPMAAGPLDAELRLAITSRLREAPVLAGGLRPDEAVAVDGLPDAAHDVLADVVPGLLPAEWARRRELDVLGVRRTRLADLVDDLAALARPARWWADLYASLDGAELEALRGLPVPLADGRLVRGPRSVVVGADAGLASSLVALGLRVADAEAAHPLLERLGAVVAEPRALLDDTGVRAAVEQSIEADDPEVVATAVLELVLAAGVEPGELEWLGALALPDNDGEWVPAGELLLPGAPLASVVAPGSLGVVDSGWVDRWGADVLAAVGALATFALVREDDVAVDPDSCDHDLDAEDGWLEELLEDLADGGAAGMGGVGGAGDAMGAGGSMPPSMPSYLAVRDLDLVADTRWPAALALLAADPALRAAVIDPLRVVRSDGRSVEVPSYTAWWLRTHPVLGGRRPDELRAAGTGAALAGLMDEAPDLGLDAAFLRAIGVVTSVAEVADSPMELPLLRAGVETAGAGPGGAGVLLAVPDVAVRVLPDVAATYVEHGELVVSGVDCEWWVDDDGTVHASTLDGLARGLAWSAGRWDARLLLAAVLADPDRADELLAEDSWS